MGVFRRSKDPGHPEKQEHQGTQERGERKLDRSHHIATVDEDAASGGLIHPVPMVSHFLQQSRRQSLVGHMAAQVDRLPEDIGIHP